MVSRATADRRARPFAGSLSVITGPADRRALRATNRPLASASHIYTPEALRLSAGADDDLIAFGPHLLHGADARDDMSLFAPTPGLGLFGLEGTDLPVGEGPVFFDDVAFVIEAAPEDVDEKGSRVGAVRATDPHGALCWQVSATARGSLLGSTTGALVPTRLPLRWGGHAGQGTGIGRWRGMVGGVRMCVRTQRRILRRPRVLRCSTLTVVGAGVAGLEWWCP